MCADAEAVQLIFDPKVTNYRQLIEFFYRMHDSTTLNRQGPDVGPQYRSGIYFHDAEQEKVAREVTKKASEQWWDPSPIVTEIVPAGKWWNAEEYHQHYLDREGGYECPSHFLRPFPQLKYD